METFSREIFYRTGLCSSRKTCLHIPMNKYDETFADGLSHMLVKYPDKIKGIQKAISLLPIEQQSKANHNMMIYIVSSWIMENLYRFHQFRYVLSIISFFQERP